MGARPNLVRAHTNWYHTKGHHKTPTRIFKLFQRVWVPRKGA